MFRDLEQDASTLLNSDVRRTVAPSHVERKEGRRGNQSDLLLGGQTRGPRTLDRDERRSDEKGGTGNLQRKLTREESRKPSKILESVRTVRTSHRGAGGTGRVGPNLQAD